MIALLLLLAAQADFSTPEKTLAAYFEARDRFARLSTLLPDLRKLAAEVEGPLATEAFQKRHAPPPIEKPPPSSHRVVSREGAVLVVEESVAGAEVRRKKILFEKAGDRWLIAKEFDACTPCKGTGACTWCGGAGERNTKVCPRCKGKKACDLCEGTKWRERSFERGIFPIGTRAFQAKNDTSSARAAAESFAEAQLELQSRTGGLMRRVFESGLDVVRKFFVESVAKSAGIALARAVEEGARGLAEHVPRVERLDESGDSATAVVACPPSPLGGGARKRIVLRRSGDRWLVDDAAVACEACDGGGVCSACKGKAAGVKCMYCQSTAKCSACNGAGFPADRK